MAVRRVTAPASLEPTTDLITLPTDRRTRAEMTAWLDARAAWHAQTGLPLPRYDSRTRARLRHHGLREPAHLTKGATDA